MRTKVCACGNPIPNLVTIEGKVRNLSNRKFCLTCSPFLGHNTRDLTQPRRNTTQYAEKFWRYQSRERADRKIKLVELLGGRCSACGYDRCVAALEFHHRDPSVKSFELSKANLLRRWEIVLTEAAKCDLLCANCHRDLEEKLRFSESEQGTFSAGRIVSSA